jgi:hypothetical protein
MMCLTLVPERVDTSSATNGVSESARRRPGSSRSAYESLESPARVPDFGCARPLDVELPTPAEMRRIATFIVGGANQLIDSWVRDPQQSPAELARTCTELALAVINPLARVSP